MQFSIVNYKDVKSEGFRIDPDFYKYEYLKIEKVLKNENDLVNIADTYELHSNGAFADIFNILHHDDSAEIVYIRSENVGDFFIDGDVEYISKYAHEMLKKTQTRIGDILTARTGKVGGASIITEEWTNSNSNQNVVNIRIKDKKDVSPFFLTTFLNTKYGINQFLRASTGNVQPWLNLSLLRKTKIFIGSSNFQKFISKLIILANNFQKQSKSIYFQTEQLLLSELGLVDWKPKQILSFVKNFSDIKQSDRTDAEYFQPKYEEIVELIKNYKNGFDELGNLVIIKDKNITLKDNGQYKYIELANISSNGEVNGYTENFGGELPSRARRKIEKGDLIISSIEGSLNSIALITENLDKLLCSTGFFILDSKILNQETLMIYLKSWIGQLFLKRGCSGTILTAISKDELMKIVLPKIDQKIQKQIKFNITEMYDLKKKSKSLLEIAKRGVEMAIEKNEEEAEKWINEKIKELGVEL